MPRKPTTDTPTAALGEFEGRDVIQVVARVIGTGDGLSKAIAINPVKHRTGDEVTIVSRAVVGPITHKLIKDTDALVRVETYEAGTVTIVADEGEIAAMLDEQERRIEEAQGIARLDFDGDPDTGE